MQKSKMAVWGGLTNSWKRGGKDKGKKGKQKKGKDKGKIYPSECRVPKKQGKVRKPS